MSLRPEAHQPGAPVCRYLQTIRDAITHIEAEKCVDRVSLVAHSAGGWLARVYLAEFGSADVANLITLGSPHQPPPTDVMGVLDQTRGLMSQVEAMAPGAFHRDVNYVCVAGR